VPLDTLLEPFGVTLAPDLEKNGKPSLGARVRGGADCTLAVVHEGSAAQKAGLSAGDVLIALDGLRVTGSNLDSLLSRYLPGAKVEVHAFRRDELRTAQVKLDGPEVSRYKLTASDKRPAARKARERWLAS
jgi:predicted metalloprotease with PDZ domain